jgi:hypothetical protein
MSTPHIFGNQSLRSLWVNLFLTRFSPDGYGEQFWGPRRNPIHARPRRKSLFPFFNRSGASPHYVFLGGVFPGITLLLTTWYNRNEQNFAISLFFSSVNLAGGYSLFSSLNHLQGVFFFFAKRCLWRNFGIQYPTHGRCRWEERLGLDVRDSFYRNCSSTASHGEISSGVNQIHYRRPFNLPVCDPRVVADSGFS